MIFLVGIVFFIFCVAVVLAIIQYILQSIGLMEIGKIYKMFTNDYILLTVLTAIFPIIASILLFAFRKKEIILQAKTVKN